MNLALFDFDGTITFKDSFKPFIYYAASRGRIALGSILLVPLIAGYKIGIIPATTTRATISFVAFRGRRKEDVKAVGAKYAQDVLPATLRAKAIETIEWHKAQGDAVVVVSAALDVYLVEWCRQVGVDVVCTELEAKDGVLTGRYRDGDCVGAEKAKRVLEKYNVKNYEVVYAYGDTIEDEAILSLADRKFFRWQEITGDVPRGRKGDHVDLHPDR